MLGENGLAKQVREVIGESVEHFGCTLVLVKATEIAGRFTLQLLLEHSDGTPVTLDECTKVNRHVSALLDVKDIIKQHYDLEVGSPGIDRPLTRPEDFSRHAGKPIKLQTELPINGQRRFKGQLLRADEAGAVLLPEGKTEEVLVAYDNIDTARLAVSDAMLTSEFKRSRGRKVSGKSNAKRKDPTKPQPLHDQ